MPPPQRVLRTVTDKRELLRHTQTAVVALQLCTVLFFGRLRDVFGSDVTWVVSFVSVALSHGVMAVSDSELMVCAARLLTVGGPYLLSG